MSASPDPFTDLPSSFRSRLVRDLHQIPPAQGYLLALSGGLDSLFLLEALSRYRQLNPDFRYRAVHVHHGLSPNADSWADHCVSACDRRQIDCRVVRVQVPRHSGAGLEASARQARYQAFESELKPGELLLLAHHQDDQAETLLLNLVRGAGVRGLAAMPRQRPLGQAGLYRPLLDWSRDELESVARNWQLGWIEDESNEDIGFDRNYLRHQVLPRLKQRWPQLGVRLTRTAGWCREADQLAAELASIDSQMAVTAQGELDLELLQGLSLARQRNLVRYWIERQGFALPGEQVFLRIFEEMIPARADAAPELRWPQARLRRYRQLLILTGEEPEVVSDLILPWHPETDLELPTGRLSVSQSDAGGLRLRLPRPNESVSVRFRQGGEVCCMPHSGRHRPLKKLLQEWGVPPWLRKQLPLAYYNDELAAVPGYFVAHGYLADPGEPGVLLRWSLPGTEPELAEP